MGSSKKRRQREQQRRKRHEQREHSRISRVMNVAPKILRRRPPGLAKMSDTLVVFAEPLLEGIGPGAPIEAYETELLCAATVWNFLLSLEVDHKRGDGAVHILDEHVGEILGILSLGTDMDDADALDLLRQLAARKQELFPDERRLIGNVHAEFRAGRVHVVALSSLPR